MRRLIRGILTRKYFRSGEWVDSPSDAENYPDTGAALERIRRERLNGVELVLQFGPAPSEMYDVHLPIRRTFARS